jgi:hypothetical protein
MSDGHSQTNTASRRAGNRHRVGLATQGGNTGKRTAAGNEAAKFAAPLSKTYAPPPREEAASEPGRGLRRAAVPPKLALPATAHATRHVGAPC